MTTKEIAIRMTAKETGFTAIFVRNIVNAQSSQLFPAAKMILKEYRFQKDFYETLPNTILKTR